MKKYQAILLDLGGVVIDLNVELFHDEFKKLGMANPDEIFSFASQADLLSQFEMGKMSEAAFLSALRASSAASVSVDAIQNAWCSMIEGVHTDTIEALKELKQHYKIYALSNTNSIHMRYIDNLFETQFAIPQLRTLFDGCFFSFEQNLRKPTKEYFEVCLDRYTLDKAQALFIDDLPGNVYAAEGVGIKALLKPRDITLRNFLNLHHII